jgi:hypothetical protein
VNAVEEDEDYCDKEEVDVGKGYEEEYGGLPHRCPRRRARSYEEG